MKHINIPIFVPHLGCPFTCIFCNQRSITAQHNVPDQAGIVAIIEEHLQTIPCGNEVEVAFFGGNFTAIDKTLQGYYLNAVSPYLQKGKINSIRISTRPDCISAPDLEYLAGRGVGTIELGVQSFSDEVLKASLRGYLCDDVFKACHLIKQQGLKLGIQLMIGLPGDTCRLDMESTGKAVSLGPDMVRIYPTLVIKGTALQNMYEQGIYKPLGLPEAIHITADMFLQFQKENIPVIRMGLQPGEELRSEGTVIVGPFHPAFGELVEQEVFRRQALQAIRIFYSGGNCRDILIFVHPQDISKMTGNKRANLLYLKESLKLESLKICPSGEMERDSIGVGGINDPTPAVFLNRMEFINLFRE
ncbi:MAG: radical SAM protein [Syntrophomonas sp.]